MFSSVLSPIVVMQQADELLVDWRIIIKLTYVFYRIITIICLLVQVSSSVQAARAAVRPNYLQTDATASIGVTHSTARPSSADQAGVLAQPIVISRVQSSYIAGTATISFSITNNLPATSLPEVIDSATVRETIYILASYVFTSYVNTLRGLTVMDSLVNGTSLLAASGAPVNVGDSLTWALPDLAPQASAVITLTIQTPASGVGFVELDSGA